MSAPPHRLRTGTSIPAVDTACRVHNRIGRLDHPLPVRDRGLGRRRQVDPRRTAAARLQGDPRRPARAGAAHVRRARLRARRLRLRPADRRPARRARAGHHDRRRVPLLLDRRALVHPRRLPRTRAVHAQHGHRRHHRRCRHRARRRAQGRARADPAPPRRRRAAARAARHRRGEQDRPDRLLGRCVRRRRRAGPRGRGAARHPGSACPARVGARGRQHRRALGAHPLVRRTRAAPAPRVASPADEPCLDTLLRRYSTTGSSSRCACPVQLVLRPQGGLAPELAADPDEAERLRDYRAVAGRISSGIVRVGDRVEIFPSGIADHRHRRPGRRHRGRRGRRARSRCRSSSPTTSTPHAAPSWSRRARFRSAAARSTPSSSSSTHGRSPRAAACSSSTAPPTVQAIVAADRVALRPRHAHARAGRRRSRRTTSAACACASPADLPIEPYETSRHGGSFLVIHPSDGATLAAGIARGLQQRRAHHPTEMPT